MVESPWNQSGRKGKVYGGNDLPKSQVLISSEWKTERVRKDASGDREDGEEDDDELPCVIGKSEGVMASGHNEMVCCLRDKSVTVALCRVRVAVMEFGYLNSVTVGQISLVGYNATTILYG